MSEVVVRMGDAVAAKGEGRTLACIGLGSCIGLVLLDASLGVAGLAHVMLPSAGAIPTLAQPGKFADTAVPHLTRMVAAHGGRPARLEALLVGGAAMFSLGDKALAPTQEIGARNDAAVRAALRSARIPVVATATGGSRGRTVRVALGTSGRAPEVVVREAGGSDETLWAGMQAARAA